VAPDVGNGCAHSFTFKDLLVATGYFNEANFIGEGGFGKVYKGKISRTNAQASPTIQEDLILLLSSIPSVIVW
jgi:hypothetical protein